MDVCDKTSVVSAARTLEKEWGRLDILINNSGYMAKFAPLLDVDDEEYAKVWDVNYWGTFRVTKAFLPILLRGGDKTIINITSMAAQFAGMGGGAYHVSKFALARFTEFVQDEYGSQVSLLSRGDSGHANDKGRLGVLYPSWGRPDGSVLQPTGGIAM